MQPESCEVATQLIIGVTNLAEQKILAYSQPTGITTILDNISGNVHLENDNRLYVSPAGNSSLIAINDNLSSNFNINLTSSYPLTGNMAKPVYRVSDDAGDFEAYYHRNVGLKRYELKDHLGNVRVVVSDALTAEGSDVSSITNDAEVLAQSDYYPFGMLQPGRNYNADRYRFGFNGQEKDDEITGGAGSHYTATFWEYDSRTGRRWNLDPVVKPWQSGYLTFAGNPILMVDPNGDDEWEINKKGKIVNRVENKEEDSFYMLNKKCQPKSEVSYRDKAVKRSGQKEHKPFSRRLYVRNDNIGVLKLEDAICDLQF